MSSGHLVLLVLALVVACGFEFINGFHDTANAVATVIYTRSLRPWQAVTVSGVCNFLGVFLGGTAVAMGIMKLLPLDLLVSQEATVSMAMVFALLISAILWNLGTWSLGLPASSSHTLIGSILGIGLGNALLSHAPLASSVNWSKAGDIGLALLISPVLGFALSAMLLFLFRKVSANPIFHQTPPLGASPPLPVRATLIMTSAGVSLAHGSNDGQKGVGLIMLILIALVPAQFALRPAATPEELQKAVVAVSHLKSFVSEAQLASERALRETDTVIVSQAASLQAMIQFTRPAIAAGVNVPVDKPVANYAEASRNLDEVLERFGSAKELSEVKREDRFEIRSRIMKIEQWLTKLEKSHDPALSMMNWSKISGDRKQLKSLIEYAPFWVLAIVAFSLGCGTMIGWKRIVVTLGEKIGKAHLTYAQGASAEIVAMSTIGLSAVLGLPVSTTHVLSSGIAGTMVANRSGLRPQTVRSILLAWVLTLPVTMALSAGLFVVFMKWIV